MKKTTFVIAVLLLALARSAQADFVETFTTPFVNGEVIPDGSLTGWSDTETVSAPELSSIENLTVTLNLSGGWNGDLYAYLVHSSGPNTGFAVLLNRVGVASGNSAGYGASVMDVTFSDAGLQNIHFVPVPTTGGTYQPDGRNISPLTAAATLGSTTPSTPLSSFDGVNLNGSWTLFIADVSAGDVSTITSWGLDITAVPEPRSVVEGGIAALFLGVLIGLYRLKQATGSLRPA